MNGTLAALTVTIAIEVPIVAAMFPRQRARMALVALVANAATNLFLNVGLPWLGARGAARIVTGEMIALVGEAAAYAWWSRPRSIPRVVVASALGNLVSFAAGPWMAAWLR